MGKDSDENVLQLIKFGLLVNSYSGSLDKMAGKVYRKKVAGLVLAFMAALFCAGCAGRTEPGGNREPSYTSEAGSTAAQNSVGPDSSGEDVTGEELPGGGLPGEDFTKDLPDGDSSGADSSGADLSGGEKSEEFSDIPEKWKIPDPPLSVLTEEEMAQVDQVIRDYYSALYTLLGYERMSNRELRGLFDHEEYSYDEVAGFYVQLEGVEPDRNIIIASKNGWVDCVVVNEGY